MEALELISLLVKNQSGHFDIPTGEMCCQVRI